jgi:hypothetical protein
MERDGQGDFDYVILLDRLGKSTKSATILFDNIKVLKSTFLETKSSSTLHTNYFICM